MPSAVKVPAKVTNPVVLYPRNVNAYEPLNPGRFCAPLTTRVKLTVAEPGGFSLSVTVIPKVKVPAWIGVPERTPVVLASVSPGGRVEPLATVQVSGVTPPVAAKVTV